MSNVCVMLNKNKRPVITDELLEAEYSEELLVEIPLLGCITAGQPIERIEENSEMVFKTVFPLILQDEI